MFDFCGVRTSHTVQIRFFEEQDVDSRRRGPKSTPHTSQEAIGYSICACLGQYREMLQSYEGDERFIAGDSSAEHQCSDVS